MFVSLLPLLESKDQVNIMSEQQVTYTMKLKVLQWLFNQCVGEIIMLINSKLLLQLTSK